MLEQVERSLAAICSKDVSICSIQELSQKPVEKKAVELGKAMSEPSSVKRVCDLQSLEDTNVNKRVHESLDDFIRQTIRCEPYMNLTCGPDDKPLQRLRLDVFNNRITAKFAKGFRVDSGSDATDFGSEKFSGSGSPPPSHVDGFKDGNSTSTEVITGLGRASQCSLKVPPADLKGWPPLSLSKVLMTKCGKCSREFCSTLNYRRHVRIHRRSLNPEKEDLSRERSKVAAFWDRLTPEEAGSIVHYENMEIEELSGQTALKALTVFTQQPGLVSLPQEILKAGVLLLDIVQNKASVFPLSSKRLLNILDDASEKTFLYSGTSVSVQRFVFCGDTGKVGLEEKNLVASMGFHIELKLVKAWMTDKEAEALRCQQALFKEEEAAQERRAKLLEKKRMKKIRQKERKGSAAHLILRGAAKTSIDDEGFIQGIGEDDDSLAATDSSSSSRTSVQDLSLVDLVDICITEDLVQAEAQGNLIVEHKVSDEGKLNLFRCQLPHRPRTVSYEAVAETFYINSDFLKESGTGFHEEKYLQRYAEEVALDGPTDVELAQLSIQNSTRTVGGLHPLAVFPRGEQERVVCEPERPLTGLKSQRAHREGSRPDDFQNSRRDENVYARRYEDDLSQIFLRPILRTNSASVKGDGGSSGSPRSSRVQQHHNERLSLGRTSGNGRVVWTRKIQQPLARATGQERKYEGPQQDAKGIKVTRFDFWDANEAFSQVGVIVSSLTRKGMATSFSDSGSQQKRDAVTPVSVAGRPTSLLPGSSTLIPFHVDVNSEDWPQLPQSSGSNYRWQSSGEEKSVLKKSSIPGSSASACMNVGVNSVSQLCVSDSPSICGLYSGRSSMVMKSGLSSVQLQGSRLPGLSSGETSSGPLSGTAEEGLTSALLIGSLNVPLGKYAVVSVFQGRFGSYCLHPEQLSRSKVANLDTVQNLEQYHGTGGLTISTQDFVSSSCIHTSMVDVQGSDVPGRCFRRLPEPGEASCDSTSTQTAKVKPHPYLLTSERGVGDHNLSPSIGHRKQTVKQGSWQPSGGRFVTAKVWRPVGVVGERHDSAKTDFDTTVVEHANSSNDICLRDLNLSRCATEIGYTPEVDPGQSNAMSRNESCKEKYSGDVHAYGNGQSPLDTNSGTDDGNQCCPGVHLNHASSVLPRVDLSLDQRVDYSSTPDQDSGVLTSDLCSSAVLEVARVFLGERWGQAVGHASIDDVLVLTSEGNSKEPKEF